MRSVSESERRTKKMQQLLERAEREERLLLQRVAKVPQPRELPLKKRSRHLE